MLPKSPDVKFSQSERFAWRVSRISGNLIKIKVKDHGYSIIIQEQKYHFCPQLLIIEKSFNISNILNIQRSKVKCTKVWEL